MSCACEGCRLLRTMRETGARWDDAPAIASAIGAESRRESEARSACGEGTRPVQRETEPSACPNAQQGPFVDPGRNTEAEPMAADACINTPTPDAPAFAPSLTRVPWFYHGRWIVLEVRS